LAGRLDLGLGQQFGEPLRRAGAAQQVAIDFGQRAERAGEQSAGEHEGGDRAAGHPARGDVDRACHITMVIAPNIRR
jgi:hypothetical protein